MAAKTVVATEAAPSVEVGTTRGEILVKVGGKSRSLVLNFERMDACEQFLGKDWSMVKIARMTSSEWNIPLRVQVAVIDAAAQEDGFAMKYAAEYSWIQVASTATALVVRALTGNPDAKKDVSGKEEEKEKPEE